MELKPGMSALVTGGASGIGKGRPSSPLFVAARGRASIRGISFPDEAIDAPHGCSAWK
jgi:hypothetical protein